MFFSYSSDPGSYLFFCSYVCTVYTGIYGNMVWHGPNDTSKADDVRNVALRIRGTAGQWDTTFYNGDGDRDGIICEVQL